MPSPVAQASWWNTSSCALKSHCLWGKCLKSPSFHSGDFRHFPPRQCDFRSHSGYFSQIPLVHSGVSWFYTKIHLGQQCYFKWNTPEAQLRMYFIWNYTVARGVFVKYTSPIIHHSHNTPLSLFWVFLSLGQSQIDSLPVFKGCLYCCVNYIFNC